MSLGSARLRRAHSYTAWARAPIQSSICAASHVQAEVPFLLCTNGYGEYHAAAGGYHFDFTAGDRYRIQAPRDRLLLPLRPHHQGDLRRTPVCRAVLRTMAASTDRFGSWETLRAALLRLVHGAMSAATGAVIRPGALQQCAARTAAARPATGFAGAHSVTGAGGRQRISQAVGDFLQHLCRRTQRPRLPRLASAAFPVSG